MYIIELMNLKKVTTYDVPRDSQTSLGGLLAPF